MAPLTLQAQQLSLWSAETAKEKYYSTHPTHTACAATMTGCKHKAFAYPAMYT